jgi:hypothetical protein
MSIHVIPPQHLIGRMQKDSTLVSREKLIETRGITRLRSTFRRWFCQDTQQWQETPDHSYFIINRMSALQSWSQQYPSQLFHRINYHQYQAMLDYICLWSDRYKYYYCMINFSIHLRSNTNSELAWLETWW